MTLVNKFLIAFILIAIGLFGVAYFDAFAYTRTPSSQYIDFNAETGNPITFLLSAGEVNIYDPCENKTRVELISPSGLTLGDFELLSPNRDITATFYNLPAGAYTAQWVLYRADNYHCSGYAIPIPADTFTITGTISIEYPVDNATYTTEPNHFSVSWSLPSSYYSASYEKKEFIIRYGTTETNLNFQSIRDIDNIATSGNIEYIPKITNLNGQGYAKATLLFCDDVGFCDRPIQSDLVVWNATTVSSITAGTPTDFGIIGNAFRDVLLWLFVPSDDAFNQFTTLLDPIKTKPPIGYFTLIGADFSSVASSSATVTWDLTAIMPVTSLFKTGFAWLLWILWAVWLLFRVTKFDWHL
jgi:hypothetical protein